MNKVDVDKYYKHKKHANGKNLSEDNCNSGKNMHLNFIIKSSLQFSLKIK